MNTATRNACITGDLHTAEVLLTQQIDADKNDHNAYANRSFVRARKADWDRALDDALRSISMQHSLTGLISKGIALCGKMQVQDAMEAFDLASMFTNEYSKATHILLLIKAIAYFNVNMHEHAILRVQNLANVCPEVDTPVCHIVEAYLRFQLGTLAFDGAYHNEADHFTSIVNTIVFTSQAAIHSKYEDFVVLFGWNLKQLWQIANQKRCDALLHAGMLREAHESYRYMMDMSDEATKAGCLDWSTVFKQKCSVLYAINGDVAPAASGENSLDASNYDKAFQLYSVAVDLNFATDAIFANRSQAKLKKMRWEIAVLDAEEVIKLSLSNYLGYQVEHAAQLYNEASEAFQVMFDNSPDTRHQELRQQYVPRSSVEMNIQTVIRAHMEYIPPRLLDTSTGRLCDRNAQIEAFETSTEYKKLLSSVSKCADLQMEHIRSVVVKYFGYVMLSHRWEGKEPLLNDIQGKSVYELNSVGSVRKLQRFCETAREAGHRWAWSCTCCINNKDTEEVSEAITSMFCWYQHSSLTIVYLYDISPLSGPGSLASSDWITRGWTLQEFLAPNIILFYRNNWTPYLDHHPDNHKQFIMQELRDATGIDSRFHVNFRPGMREPREKLKWASKRVTEKPEDAAYSLFGVFGVHLPMIYGESKQKALGRLLEEIVSQSRDISVLDWVGKSSEFNSCLPADITSYASSSTLPCLSEDEIRTSIFSLRVAGDEWVALELYNKLYATNPPSFSNQRLHLPCIAFHVTKVKRRRDQGLCFTYDVEVKGLCDLVITTEQKLIQFSREKPTARRFLLVHPWDCRLLELPDFSDDTDSVDDSSLPPSPSDSHGGFPGEQELLGSESSVRALRLIARLKQPFKAFLLSQKYGEEYRRIASDHEIMAQIKETTSICDMIDCVTTVEVV
ncbi:hypothetical protein BDR07DRAFT_1331577 [Suillus spraguei]|nr:hypothetical protein BDR07DRAFT_1331577 [Suillus spraguei]